MQSLMKGAVEAFRKPYGTRFGMGPICKRCKFCHSLQVDVTASMELEQGSWERHRRDLQNVNGRFVYVQC